MGKTKIRFKGYTEDWEQRKFGDLGSVAMCKRVFKATDERTCWRKSHIYKIADFWG